MKIVKTNAEVVASFSRSLDVVGSFVFKDFSVMQKVLNAKRKVGVVLNEYQESYKKISEQECLKDEKGNPKHEIREERQVYAYADEETRKRTLNLLEELNATEVELDLEPITLTELKDVEGITPNLIQSLGELIVYDE
jgi:hypothetical protein